MLYCIDREIISDGNSKLWGANPFRQEPKTKRFRNLILTDFIIHLNSCRSTVHFMLKGPGLKTSINDI
jgi:hypothetical protein